MTHPRTVPDDPTLPQLATLLDTQRMAGEFDHRMREGDEFAACRVSACHIERVKYKPGYNCLINYRLSIEEPDTAARREQLLCARGYVVGDSTSRYHKACRQTLHKPLFGPPLFHIEPLSLVVWAFPNDRKLDGLSALRDTDLLRRHILPPVVHRRWGSNWQIDTLRQTIAHYEPEHTCCVRVELSLSDRESGSGRDWVIFGKTYYDGQGEEAFGNMRQLWTHNGSSPHALSIPRPLAYQPDYRLLWQEGIRGETVLASHPDYRLDPTLVQEVARAIAALHRAPIVTRRELILDDVVRRLREVESLLPPVRPTCGPSLRRIIARLISDVPDDGHLTATLHGDLHLKNIFSSERGVALIDLDTLLSGPPLHDIGTLVAIMLLNSGTDNDAPPWVITLIDAFVDIYRSEVPWPVSRTALHWYTAATLVTVCAFRCVKRLEPGWVGQLTRIIALAEHTLTGAHR